MGGFITFQGQGIKRTYLTIFNCCVNLFFTGECVRPETAVINAWLILPDSLFDFPAGLFPGSQSTIENTHIVVTGVMEYPPGTAGRRQHTD